MRALAVIAVTTMVACADEGPPPPRTPGQPIGDARYTGGDPTSGDPASGDPSTGDPSFGDSMAGDPTGGDYTPPLGPCSPNGSGTVTGSVQGHSIATVNTAGTRVTGAVEVIALTSWLADSCFDELEADKLLLTPCSMAVGTYNVVDFSEWDCGTSPNAAWALMEGPTGTDIAGATSGTITITSVSDACAAGGFSVVFETESLSGTFDAQRCPLP